MPSHADDDATTAFLPATELLGRIRRRELAVADVVDALLRRIERLDPALNAYVHLFTGEARERARQADAVLAAGEDVGPLHGLPIAMKDLFDFKVGAPNTFGSRPFANWMPPVSSLYVERLEQAGGIIIGKTNTPEFGFRGTTDNLLFGPTSTPFGIGKNAGGSSGGSAAAVAAGLAAVAIGSDGGGSIKIPAAWSGVFGFAPSFGRVPSIVRPNAFALAAPYAFPAGPLTRTVADAALVLDVITGEDTRDPFSLSSSVDYQGSLRTRSRPLRVAWTPDFGVFPVEPEVARIARAAVDALADAGADVREVDLGLRRTHQELFDVWERMSAVRFAADAEGFKEAGYDFDAFPPGTVSSELSATLRLGRAQSAVAYRLDDNIRTEVLDAFAAVFADFDVLASPTVAALPVDNASDGNTVGPAQINGVPVDPLLGWCMTYLYNLAGNPAASLPAGRSAHGLPVGLQLAAAPGADATLMAASAAFERAQPWARQYDELP